MMKNVPNTIPKDEKDSLKNSVQTFARRPPEFKVTMFVKYV